MHYISDVEQFYFKLLNELGLKISIRNHIKYIYNDSLKDYQMLTCNYKPIILSNFDYLRLPEQGKLSKIVFNPFDKNLESCSLLIVEDSIHTKLSIFIYSIFKKVLNIKFNLDTDSDNNFDCKSIDKLPDGDKNTIYKWHNLYTTVNTTFFSRNLIGFSIDLTNNSQSAQVNFTYPLYDYLNTVHTDFTFGIHLKNSEIELFKQVYKHYIIDPIEAFFATSINISHNSNKFSKFYIQMKIYLEIKKLLRDKYLFTSHLKINKITNNEIDNLNNYSSKESDLNTLEIQISNQKSYQNELQTRKEYNPNWLLLKDDTMKQDISEAQTEDKDIIKNSNSEIEVFKSSLADEKAIEELNNLFDLLADDKAMLKYKNNLKEIVSLSKNAVNYTNIKQQQKEALLNSIYYWQNVVLEIINRQTMCLWNNDETEKYCFRAGINNKIKYGNKKEISKKITTALNDELMELINSNYYQKVDIAIEIKIIDNIEDAFKTIEKYHMQNFLLVCIFSQKIHTIHDEVFNIRTNSEFYKYYDNNYWTRNLFIYTPYLIKRFPQYSYNQNIQEKKSFIEQFIFVLVNENTNTFHHVMNWLASYFQTLQKSKIALVLTGDKEATEDIFFNSVIQEIFGSNYCTTINDDEFKTSSTTEIVKDTLFFNISDISKKKTKFDDKTLSRIVRELLVHSTVKGKDKTSQRIPILGQTIITADNPYPYIKDSYSQCTVIKVKELANIMVKLNILDRINLDTKIENDLDNFSNILAQYPINQDLANLALDTEDRELPEKKNKETLIDKNDLDNNIDKFIDAIKNMDIKYFEKVKEDAELYDELKDSFSKGMIPSPELNFYFNIVYGQEIFTDKKKILGELKKRDELFNQQIDTKKDDKENIIFQAHKTSKLNKKQFKIKDYTLKTQLKKQ